MFDWTCCLALFIPVLLMFQVWRIYYTDDWSCKTCFSILFLGTLTVIIAWAAIMTLLGIEP
jgi:hypothetical protein